MQKVTMLLILTSMAVWFLLYTAISHCHKYQDIRSLTTIILIIYITTLIHPPKHQAYLAGQIALQNPKKSSQ